MARLSHPLGGIGEAHPSGASRSFPGRVVALTAVQEHAGWVASLELGIDEPKTQLDAVW